MRLYRGQKYGGPVGRWWTTNLEDARAYARSRGGNTAWVVLAVEVDGRRLARFLFDRRTGKGSTYQIQPADLVRHSLAVRIVDGFLELPGARRPA